LQTLSEWLPHKSVDYRIDARVQCGQKKRRLQIYKYGYAEILQYNQNLEWGPANSKNRCNDDTHPTHFPGG
jgi:hypothetical protein